MYSYLLPSEPHRPQNHTDPGPLTGWSL